jgi:hypothetical protein
MKRPTQDWGPFLRAVVGDPRPRLGARLKSVREDLGIAVHDDVIRIQAAMTLLRPLAEGLALFAEFDALSRTQSRAWSPLPIALVLNFAGPECLARGPHVEPFKTSAHTRTPLRASAGSRSRRTVPVC